MSTERLLQSLALGDIFHAESTNGASLICLVTSVSELAIEARTVTTQIRIRFDRHTGKAVWGEHDISCSIDSIARLPSEIRSVLLGIDEKFGLERNVERLRLTDAEKRALIFVDDYYAANRISTSS
jgi:hypothetical protein